MHWILHVEPKSGNAAVQMGAEGVVLFLAGALQQNPM